MNDDIITSHSIVDHPDGIILKSKPTRRGGRRRRRNKNRQNKKIDQLEAKVDKLSQQIESSNAHAQNNNDNIKKSTRDASTNTIISATNTNFDELGVLYPKRIMTDKKYTNLRSIHDGDDCYEESLVPFKLHDEAFYRSPRSKTLVKVRINKVFRPPNPLCAIRYYSSAIDSAMFHDQLYILKRGEQSIKHTSSAPQDMYVYKRLLPEVNWKVGSIAFYRKSSRQMMEVQIKQVIPSSQEHPITRYRTSFSSDLLYHNELYILKKGRE